MSESKKLIYQDLVSGNSVVLDEDASALEGHEVIVQIEEATARRGSWDAIKGIWGLVSAPAEFDARKAIDDIYD